MTATRTYAAMRVDAGLYVQPSNDGARRFVIARYEDGRMYGLEQGPWLRTYWAWGELDDVAAHRIERLAEYEPEDELRDAARHSEGYKTKREAVEAALKSEGTA